MRDEQHQCSLGNLRIPLSQLLASEDMTMNQRFQLSNSGPNSSLKMKLALRVLPSAECGRGCTGPLVPHAGPGGAGGSGSRVLGPQLFVMLSREANQPVDGLLAQEVLLSLHQQFSGNVKFSKGIRRRESNIPLQGGRNFRKKKFSDQYLKST